MTPELVMDVIAEMQEIASQPKCNCAIGVGKPEDALMMTDWTRCKVCGGLVSRVRYVEGTAVLVDGTIQ